MTKDEGVTKDDLAEGLAALRTELKNDIAEFREEVRNEFLTIHHELAHINHRLDQLEENYANLKGVTKEIDDLRSDVRAIEKHLGIHKKIAA